VIMPTSLRSHERSHSSCLGNASETDPEYLKEQFVILAGVVLPSPIRARSRLSKQQAGRMPVYVVIAGGAFAGARVRGIGGAVENQSGS
jgi:hypothetical protein